MASENREMAGEWLNAKTRTGMTSQRDIRISPTPAVAPAVRAPRSHEGMRYRLVPNRMRISGYTSQPVTSSITRCPATLTAIITAMRRKESTARGGEAMPSWLTSSESTVLVMDTP